MNILSFYSFLTCIVASFLYQIVMTFCMGFNWKISCLFVGCSIYTVNNQRHLSSTDGKVTSLVPTPHYWDSCLHHPWVDWLFGIIISKVHDSTRTLRSAMRNDRRSGQLFLSARSWELLFVALAGQWPRYEFWVSVKEASLTRFGQSSVLMMLISVTIAWVVTLTEMWAGYIGLLNNDDIVYHSYSSSVRSTPRVAADCDVSRASWVDVGRSALVMQPSNCRTM